MISNNNKAMANKSFIGLHPLSYVPDRTYLNAEVAKISIIKHNKANTGMNS